MTIRYNCPKRASGHALLLTLVTIGIVGLVLLSYLRLTTNQSHRVMRSQVWNSALALAEAGVEEALNHCVYNDTNIVSNNWKIQGNVYQLTQPLGDGKFIASISKAWPYQIISEGFFPMPASSKLVSRRVRVMTTNMNVFFSALTVRANVELNGNNVMIDSYDSSVSTKSTLGKYDPAKAGDNGNVVCAQGLKDSMSIGNADIFGHIYTGPSATVKTGPNGGVGSHAWRGGNNGIEKGWWVKDFSISFPDITAPYPSAPIAGGGSYNSTTYDFILPGGSWMSSQLYGKTVVTGNATILVTDSIDYGSGSLEIVPGASLTIYMAGNTTFIGATINANSSATNLTYYGLPSNKHIDIKTGGAAFTGAIYAPDAELFVNGNNDLYGGAVVKSATLVGNAAIHLDESLQIQVPARGLVIKSWDEL